MTIPAKMSAGRPRLSSANPYRVMLVDDSAVIRGIFARALDKDIDIEIVATVGDGVAALSALARFKVEVVVLDIEMPRMDGLTAIPKILQVDPLSQIIMASTLTLKNAEISLKALSLGAADYIPKPSSSGDLIADDFQRELVMKVKALGAARRKASGEAPARLFLADRRRHRVPAEPVGGPVQWALGRKSESPNASRPEKRDVPEENQPPVVTTVVRGDMAYEPPSKPARTLSERRPVRPGVEAGGAGSAGAKARMPIVAPEAEKKTLSKPSGGATRRHPPAQHRPSAGSRGTAPTIRTHRTAVAGQRSNLASGRASSGRASGRASGPGSVSEAAQSDGAEAAPLSLRPISKGLSPPQAIAIGSSTGGPQALFAVLANLPRDVTQPIFLTQHMPATFTTILAEHLTRTSGRTAREGENGEIVEPGRIYVAPGNYHMVLEKKGPKPVIRTNQAPPENFCRPSVDPMLRSVTQVYGKNALVLILTGMGQDGLKGGAMIVESGGVLIAQDEATSVVWGMPGAVAQAGLCSAVLPLPEIGPFLVKLARGQAA